MFNWFVIQSKPGQLLKAQAELEQQGFETYLCNSASSLALINPFAVRPCFREFCADISLPLSVLGPPFDVMQLPMDLSGCISSMSDARWWSTLIIEQTKNAT